MLRGNHEDKNVNRHLGFGEECAKRLEEDINSPNSVFQKINEVFESLPLVAIINDKTINTRIFCVHGGIGSTVHKLEDIEKIKRPCEISLGEATNQEQQMIVDLLWSDPLDNEEETGVQANQIRDPTQSNNITRFGADRVDKFLKSNNLSIILRSHQNCPDGIDRFASGSLITVSSCTDYCGKYNNDACFIVVQKRLVISPKIIKPTPQSKQSWVEFNIQSIPESVSPVIRRPHTPLKPQPKQ